MAQKSRRKPAARAAQPRAQAKSARKAGTAKKVARRKPVARKKAPVARKQPETLRLSRAAMGFTVADIERSLAWYRDVLGCVVKDRWENEGRLMGAELVAGAVTFYLGQDDWKKGRDRQKGQGCRAYFTTGQNLDALAASIKAKGWPLEQEPTDQPWGWRDFSLADPDGFKLTIARG